MLHITLRFDCSACAAEQAAAQAALPMPDLSYCTAEHDGYICVVAASLDMGELMTFGAAMCGKFEDDMIGYITYAGQTRL